MIPTIKISECFLLYLNDADSHIGKSPRNIHEQLSTLILPLGLPSHFHSVQVLDQDEVTNCVADIVRGGKKAGSTKLLIAGGILEREVTLFALHALAEGLDVFILADLISIENDKYEKRYWERLIQAGAVPTTFSQTIVEWIASESDPVFIEKLVAANSLLNNS